MSLRADNVRRRLSTLSNQASSLYGSPLVKLFVGPTKTLITAHLTVLEKSKFFERCLQQQRFQESIDLEVNLPEDDPRTMSYIIDWLYGGGAYEDVFENLCDKFENLPSTGNKLELEKNLTETIAAYVLADKQGMEAMQNEIVDEIHEHITKFPVRWSHIEQFKIAEVERLPLRNLLIRKMAREIREQNWHVQRDLKEDVVNDLKDDAKGCLELMTFLMRDGANTDITQESSCKWHTHDYEKKCPEQSPKQAW